MQIKIVSSRGSLLTRGWIAILIYRATNEMSKKAKLSANPVGVMASVREGKTIESKQPRELAHKRLDCNLNKETWILI